MKKVDLLQAPIPGQSLTGSPKNYPWERPPEMVEVKEVVNHYIKKIANEDVMDDLAITFKLGADLQTVTETIMTTGAMKGLHTVDAGMLAGPHVAAFIKAGMSTYDVPVKETPVTKAESDEYKHKSRLALLLEAELEKVAPEEVQQDEGLELLSDMQETLETEQPQEEAPMEEEGITMPPKGLMAKESV